MASSVIREASFTSGVERSVRAKLRFPEDHHVAVLASINKNVIRLDNLALLARYGDGSVSVPGPGKVWLQVTGENLNVVQANDVIQFLSVCNRVTAVDLASSCLNDETCEAICMALSTYALNLRLLDLSGNALGTLGGGAVAAVMHYLKNVQVINLRLNQLMNDGVKQIAQALHHAKALTSLNVAANSIGPEGAAALGEALSKHEMVVLLDLSGNEIGDLGIDTLAETLGQARALQTLRLVANRISPDGGYSLARLLSESSSLLELDVGSNALGNAGAQALAEALPYNHNLIRLNLRANNIGDHGAIAFSSVVSGALGHPLRQLTLSDNDIGTEGCTALADALQFTSSTLSLNMSNNNLTPEEARLLLAAIHAGAALRFACRQGTGFTAVMPQLVVPVLADPQAANRAPTLIRVGFPGVRRIGADETETAAQIVNKGGGDIAANSTASLVGLWTSQRRLRLDRLLTPGVSGLTRDADFLTKNVTFAKDTPTPQRATPAPAPSTRTREGSSRRSRIPLGREAILQTPVTPASGTAAGATTPSLLTHKYRYTITDLPTRNTSLFADDVHIPTTVTSSFPLTLAAVAMEGDEEARRARSADLAALTATEAPSEATYKRIDWNSVPVDKRLVSPPRRSEPLTASALQSLQSTHYAAPQSTRQQGRTLRPATPPQDGSVSDDFDYQLTRLSGGSDIVSPPQESYPPARTAGDAGRRPLPADAPRRNSVAVVGLPPTGKSRHRTSASDDYRHLLSAVTAQQSSWKNTAAPIQERPAKATAPARADVESGAVERTMSAARASLPLLVVTEPNADPPTATRGGSHSAQDSSGSAVSHEALENTNTDSPGRKRHRSRSHSTGRSPPKAGSAAATRVTMEGGMGAARGEESDPDHTRRNSKEFKNEDGRYPPFWSGKSADGSKPLGITKGYLRVRSSDSDEWHVRWCVLDGAILQMLAERDTRELASEVLLSGYEAQEDKTVRFEGSSVPSIKVWWGTTDIAWFQALTEEHAKWLDAFQAAGVLEQKVSSPTIVVPKDGQKDAPRSLSSSLRRALAALENSMSSVDYDESDRNSGSGSGRFAPPVGLGPIAEPAGATTHSETTKPIAGTHARTGSTGTTASAKVAPTPVPSMATVKEQPGKVVDTPPAPTAAPTSTPAAADVGHRAAPAPASTVSTPSTAATSVGPVHSETSDAVAAKASGDSALETVPAEGSAEGETRTPRVLLTRSSTSKMTRESTATDLNALTGAPLAAPKRQISMRMDPLDSTLARPGEDMGLRRSTLLQKDRLPATPNSEAGPSSAAASAAGGATAGASEPVRDVARAPVVIKQANWLAEATAETVESVAQFLRERTALFPCQLYEPGGKKPKAVVLSLTLDEQTIVIFEKRTLRKNVELARLSLSSEIVTTEETDSTAFTLQSQANKENVLSMTTGPKVSRSLVLAVIDGFNRTARGTDGRGPLLGKTARMTRHTPHTGDGMLSLTHGALLTVGQDPDRSVGGWVEGTARGSNKSGFIHVSFIEEAK